MKKSLKTMLILAIFAFGLNTVSAQITITIPKIPKIKKPKIEQPKDTTNTNSDDNRTVQNGSSEQTNSNSTTGNEEEMDARLRLFLEEIAKAQKEVDEYSSDTKLYLVGGVSTEWLWRAVSAKERNEWNEKWKSLMSPTAQKKFDAAFIALADSAAKKLPAYKSGIKNYTIRNAAEERLMKGVLTKIADYQIYSLGLKQANWLIDKNDYGLPTARYKHGVIYLRDTQSDHPYCYATYINIKQDYAGGGTYGASYARFIEDEMVGCPAGK